MMAFFVRDLDLKIIIDRWIGHHKVIKANLVPELILYREMVFSCRLIVAKSSCDSEVLRSSVEDNPGRLPLWCSHIESSNIESIVL